MKFRTIVGLLIVLIGCSCIQQPSNSGLLIENGINRGISYTDSLGTNYSIRYIPITITNDSTIPIHLQMAFSKEYDYPIAYGNQKFKVFLMPKEWATDRGTITDSMVVELKIYIEKPLLNETIEPGEKYLLAIGTLYPNPAKISGVLPNLLFAQSNGDNFQSCDFLMDQDKSTNSKLALGLKLVFNESCLIIPCGKISYPEN